MVTADLENEASILYLFRSLVTTWDLRGRGKLGLCTGQIKMAASGYLALDDLRKLVIEKIEDVCSSLLHPSEILDVEDVLEKIDQIVEAVHCLDSSIRLPEDIYRDISTAKKIIEKSSSTSTRTPWIQTNMPGRPSYDIPQEQIQSLIDLGFKVTQISELLHVSTRTVERRLAQ